MGCFFYCQIIMALIDKLKHLIESLRLTLMTSRGHDVWLFLSCLFVAYLFWWMLTLNNEVQEDYEVPVEIDNIPDGITVLSDVPESVKVSVRDKASALIRFNWMGVPKMKIDWRDYQKGDRFIFGNVEMNSRLRSYFGSGSRIVTIKPDSLRVVFTTIPGRRVPVVIDADVRPALGYVVNGEYELNVDSVTLYSKTDLPHGLLAVQTMPIVKAELDDTTHIQVRIKSIDGVRIEPDRVDVTIPVEPLISRKQIVPITVQNLPSDVGLITFPSKVEVSYLVPMSMYNVEQSPLNAYVDYNKVLEVRNGKVNVSMSLMPDVYQNVDISPDSVEFIIEKKRLNDGN